ncbi:MAG: serine/threonine protein kinase [Actinomycetota bacterium]
MHLDLSDPFAAYEDQDSGCVSYGIEADGRRWHVKIATDEQAEASLRSAIRFHAAVRHPAIVAPVEVVEAPRLTLVAPWIDGFTLNQATRYGSDRSGLRRFQAEPVGVVLAGLDRILDAHLAVVAAGFVAVDLYDGCFHVEVPSSTTYLIDLDEYRPGPFVVEDDRLPGASSYMAPEEWRRGATIDERTTVFGLGRTLQHLLAGPDGWRGSAERWAVVERATATAPHDRHQRATDLVQDWRAAGG